MKQTLISSLVILILMIFGPAYAEENQAMVKLKAMSDYVGRQQIIELAFDSAIEIITPQLEKIQFTNSGEAVLQRPDKLWAHRLGGYTDVEMFFDGKTVGIHGRHLNGYAQFDVPGSTDYLIHSLREGHGVALPGADLLLTDSYELLSADIQEAKYIGHGVIDGTDCEHLAFRNQETDWQIWIETGENPVPRKLVITSKTVNCAPQYTLFIRHWKTDTVPDPERFSFTPPKGADLMDHNDLIELDELPQSAEKGETP